MKENLDAFEMVRNSFFIQRQNLTIKENLPHVELGVTSYISNYPTLQVSTSWLGNFLGGFI
jgi:hypothetical protein